MSVYTVVSPAELADWLRRYRIGNATALTGINAGVENTNYFLDTDDGHYVLTLFERMPAAELRFYLAFTDHLARHGLPVPGPVADVTGAFCSPLCGKPAAVVTRLAGQSVMQPSAAHCAAIGRFLGQMHRAAADFPEPPPRPRGRDWLMAARHDLRADLDAATQTRLDAELAWQDAQDRDALPRGIVHADLFRDNALFRADGTLGGVIDFYFSGEDALLFDLAVTANDWCMPDQNGGLCRQRTRALLTAYHAERPLTDAEHDAWPGLLRAAALRFWVSRLEDLHRPRPGDLVLVKDPDALRAVLDGHTTTTHFPWIDAP